MTDDDDLLRDDLGGFEPDDSPPDAQMMYSAADDSGALDQDAAEPDEAGTERAEPFLTSLTEPAVLGPTERLRQPRAQDFRRRLRNQISLLPLALSSLALGGYLIARQQDIAGLPDISTAALGSGVVLVVAFTAVFHAVIFGRRESGLLFAGLVVWVTAGLIVLLRFGIDQQAQATKWWPLLLVALSLTLLLTYLTERAHDVRLVLLSVLVLVAGATAYLVTSGRIGEQVLDKAADYWPLLLTVIGIGLLPLAFRRRAG